MNKILPLVLQKKFLNVNGLVVSASALLTSQQKHCVKSWNIVQTKNMSNFKKQQIAGSLEFQTFDNKKIRHWIDDQSCQQTPEDFEFKLMTYNILAQELLETHSYLYRNHDRRALNWPHRYKLLIREILDERPEILCLQEGSDHNKSIALNHVNKFLHINLFTF